MLHVLSQLAREARYVVLYGSCSADTTFSAMFRALLVDLPLRYHNDHRTESVASRLVVFRAYCRGGNSQPGN
jgi:hypothetical protein